MFQKNILGEKICLKQASKKFLPFLFSENNFN